MQYASPEGKPAWPGGQLGLRWKSGCYREVWWRRLARDSNKKFCAICRLHSIDFVNADRPPTLSQGWIDDGSGAFRLLMDAALQSISAKPFVKRNRGGIEQLGAGGRSLRCIMWWWVLKFRHHGSTRKHRLAGLYHKASSEPAAAQGIELLAVDGSIASDMLLLGHGSS